MPVLPELGPCNRIEFMPHIPKDAAPRASAFLSCNGLGCSPVQILAGLAHSHSQVPGWFRFPGRDVVLTHQGRYAIHLICRLLNIGPGDEVLVPAYNCGAEVDPFIWAGAKAVFYRIDDKAALDLDDIVRRVTPATKVVYVTHFFGWPQDLDELAQWCKEKRLFLVEDCALALFSDGPNNTIGRVGDAAIYSFVKSLPVPDGGALVLGNGSTWKDTRIIEPPPFHNSLLNTLPLLKKWFMHTSKLWQRYEPARELLNRSWLKRPTNQDNEIEREMPESNYFDEQKINWSMSGISNSILSQVDPDSVAARRQRNYRQLHDSLRDVPSIKLLFDDLPEAVTPWSFPFFVKDRNRWCHALEDKGILVGGWPSYHRGLDWKDFPEARHLKNDLLTLPVHQGLDGRHMEYIAGYVRTVAANQW